MGAVSRLGNGKASGVDDVKAEYRFRSGLSNKNAINDMLQKVYNALDRREYTLCVMIDLSKAFDTLNRLILLKKT